MSERPSAILDMDGTLVDTNYRHAIAWYRAFKAYDVVDGWTTSADVEATKPEPDLVVAAVFESVEELRTNLEDTPLRR